MQGATLLPNPSRALGQMWKWRRHPVGLIKESESGQRQQKDKAGQKGAAREDEVMGTTERC